MGKIVEDPSCGHCGEQLEGPPSSHHKVDGKPVHTHCFEKVWEGVIQGSSS